MRVGTLAPEALGWNARHLGPAVLRQVTDRPERTRTAALALRGEQAPPGGPLAAVASAPGSS